MKDISDFTQSSARLSDTAEPLSAYEKAAAEGIDPRCIPQSLTETPPIGNEILYPDYSAEEHETWQILYSRQAACLPGRASTAFLNGMADLNLSPDRIPSLKGLSETLTERTNWRVARVPGLLHEQDFFRLLAVRIFPSTDYIRGRHELGYTPAPDLFHDIFGHMPMLTNPDFADFYQLFGKAALNATGFHRTALERLHWFAVEFGLIRESEGMRIFGAGTLSSPNEVMHSLSEKVSVRPFTVYDVIHQEYDVWHLQPILFSIASFESLKADFVAWGHESGLL
jgi:phenylalanine-4-hydroxylase